MDDGRNASLGGGWHVPRILRRINSDKDFFSYIVKKEVIESIRMGGKAIMI
jgi:hypothetical protein